MAATVAEPPAGGTVRQSWSDRIGIPRPLLFGFIGVLLFMVGDGVESGLIAPYLNDSSAGSDARAGYIITVYGVAVAIASWVSGALSDIIGPRRVMAIGAAVWLVFEVLFLLVGVPSHSYGLQMLLYGLRGFGYPLFAFGFLVWISATTSAARLGTAVGWFYFAFTGGLPTLGTLFASVSIPVFGGSEDDAGGINGDYWTFWASAVIIAIGAAFALLGVRERTGFTRLAPPEVKAGPSLLRSLSILREHPRVTIGCIVRVINTMPEFGSLVFFPAFFGKDNLYSDAEWLRLLAIIYATNIFFNLIFGALSDRIGWRGTIFWFGAIGCAISLFLLYFVPLEYGKGHYWSVSVPLGMLYGATLAGFVPISALVPSLAPENKGGSLAMLNLGAGLAALVGPLIASLFLPLGRGTVIVIFCAFYLVAAALTVTLKLPPESRRAIETGTELGHGQPEGATA